jgi:toxin ParE1/3/4
MTYHISNEANNDMENIWIYTLENWSIEQADRYINLLIDEIEYLCAKPNSGFDFGKIRKGYFRVKVKSHFIFYKINSKQNQLEIIRVLHEIMDIESHLHE